MFRIHSLKEFDKIVPVVDRRQPSQTGLAVFEMRFDLFLIECCQTPDRELGQMAVIEAIAEGRGRGVHGASEPKWTDDTDRTRNAPRAEFLS